MAKTKKRADGLYQMQITLGRKHDGSYIRKTIYGRTLKEIKQKEEQITQQMNQGIDISKDKMTFKNITDIWIEQYNTHINPNWKKEQRQLIEKYLLPTLKDIKIKDIKQYHLQGVINTLAENNYKTSTMKKVKQLAVQILETAVNNDLLVKNIFSKVAVPSVKANARRALTESEIKLLTETYTEHRMGHVAMIMMYCGLRRGEVLALEWKDIDLEIKILSVNKSLIFISNQPEVKPSTKSIAGMRDVPIPDVLIDILKSVDRESSKFVCPNINGGIMSGIAYKRAWQSYQYYLNLKAGGTKSTRTTKGIQVLDNITAHMLRHTYASILYDAGVDIKSAQKFLGHANVEMTLSVYTHLSKYKENEAINSLNRHLEKKPQNQQNTIELKNKKKKR